MVEVVQEDRQAAEYFAGFSYLSILQHQLLEETFARHRIAAEQRSKIEGARLAIEAAADWLACAPPHLSMQEYADAIRALSPAKIVGEG